MMVKENVLDKNTALALEKSNQLSFKEKLSKAKKKNYEALAALYYFTDTGCISRYIYMVQCMVCKLPLRIISQAMG